MTFDTTELEPTGLGSELVELLLQEHQTQVLPRLERLWRYYRNELLEGDGTEHGRRYRLGQEEGLPARLTRKPEEDWPAKEIVIENDIAWRLHAMVDFMFGKPVVLQSQAPDPVRASLLERFLRKVFDVSGGIGLFQDMALLGGIYGYVDVVLRLQERARAAAVRPAMGRRDHGRSTRAREDNEELPSELATAAGRFVLELVEGPRAVPVVNPRDYRRLDAYVVHYRQQLNEVEEPGVWTRWRQRLRGQSATGRRRISQWCTQIWTEEWLSRFETDAQGEGAAQLVERSINRLGRVPVVHIQNLPMPFFYEGLSEVEPLIPLQDELNIRLSDRANRVTLQSFKMYLGKGIEGFGDRLISPGQMWATENTAASIQEFGGDAASPSEEAHIGEIRDAMDKTSGVSALAAGLLRNKVGNLTSENALRIVMAGLLAKTEKKRITYGAGIAQLCELILHAADVYGVLPNRPEERGIRLDWANPLPEEHSQRLRDAQVKLELGVPRKQVLAELGYDQEEVGQSDPAAQR